MIKSYRKLKTISFRLICLRCLMSYMWKMPVNEEKENNCFQKTQESIKLITFQF